MDTDFLCQECGQTFNARWKLESHVKCKHDSKTYKCPKCEEEIIGKGNVENHLREHKTKTCGTCKVVMPLNSWSSHKANCSGNLLSCEKCSYTTKLKGSLKRHHASIHEPITLKIHVIFHHYEEYFEATGTNFRTTNGEHHEALHHSLKMFERKKGLNMQQKTWLLHAPTEISHLNFIL